MNGLSSQTLGPSSSPVGDSPLERSGSSAQAGLAVDLFGHPLEDNASPSKATKRARSGHGGEDLQGRSVMLVDTFGLLYRVFHSMGSILCPAGREVGATYGFVSTLLDLVQRCSPDYLVAVFDVGSRNFRHDLYGDYKANRQPIPAELKQQLPMLEAVLEALGVGNIGCPGFEADDVAATLARRIESAGGECLIVSNDKDFRQLVTERVSLYRLRGHEIWDAAAVQRDWGIRPDQCVDYQALVGDPVDNVPGIRLVGPKLASQLLQKFGTLENVLANAGAVSGPARRANLLAGREIAMLSRQLVQLCVDVPCEMHWEEALVGRASPAVIRELFDELGFVQLKHRAMRLVARR